MSVLLYFNELRIVCDKPVAISHTVVQFYFHYFFL